MALSLTDQVVVSGTNFATLALLANWCGLSVGEVGVYGLALTIIGFLRTGQERLLSNPYLVFMHHKGREQPAFLGSSLFFQSRFAMVCSAFLLVLSAAFAWLERPTGLSQVLLVLAFAAPFLLLRDHVRAICAANFRFGTALVVDLCVCAIQLGSLLLLHMWESVTVPRLCIIMGVACLIPTVAWRRLGVQPIVFERSRLKRDWVESWRYSCWLLAARTVGIAGYYAVPWFVVFYLTERDAGVFATCSSLVGLSLMFIMGANNYFQPRTVVALHERGVSAMARSIVETIVVIGSVLAAVSCMFYFAGDWLMGIFGANYTSFGHIVFWLSLSMLAVCISIVCGNGFAALVQPRGYFWGEVSYCVTACALAWVLIPRFQLVGAALALVGAGVAASAVTGLTLIHLIRSRVAECQIAGAHFAGSHA